MSKIDYYITEKNVNKIKRGEYTNFLDPLIYKRVISKLKGSNYQVYYPYKDSEKVTLYTKILPEIRYLEIISTEKLTHREIIGSLIGLNIDKELFGDIIITNNHYYIMVMDSIYQLIVNYYHMVGNKYIKLKEISKDIIIDYERKYQEIELIVPSLRIDAVISKLISTSRDQIKEKFLSDEIILNYEPCHKVTYNLKTNDIFSIHKYGKYKFDDIINTSKKGNYIIRCYKYIDE